MGRPNKPLWPYVLNRDCDLARGLVAWFPGGPSGGNQVFDRSMLGRGNHGAFGTAPAWVPGKDGGKEALQFVSASSQYVECPAAAITGHPCTIAAWVKPTTAANFALVNVTCLTTTTRITLEYRSGSVFRAGTVDDGNTGGSATGTVTSAIGTWGHAVAVHTSVSSRSVYTNGGNVVSDSTALTTFTGLNRTMLGCTYINSARGTFSNSVIGEVALWNRALNASEVFSLYHPQTRWQLRYQPGRKKWFLGVSGGNAYTLTASAGSFSLSGQAATLKAARTLTCSAGSFALSGQPAGLAVGRKVSAAAGAYTLSGQPSGLTVARRLTADAGSFTLSGQSAGLLKGRTLACSAGSFTLSGQVAGLAATRSVPAGAGSFSLSGQAAGLITGRGLAAGAGAFTVSGQGAGLAAARRLGVASGPFTLSGQGAGLDYSGAAKVVTAGAGAFSLSGQAAALRATRTLACSAGSFALTGQSAGLRRTLILPSGVGTFTLSGQAAGFARGFGLVAAVGAFALSGLAAALRVARALPSALGDFLLTGRAATLTYSPSAPASDPVRIVVVRAAANAPVLVRAAGNTIITLRGSLSMSQATGLLKFHQGEAREYWFRVDGLPVTADWTTAFTLYAADGAATLTITPDADTPERGYLTVTLTHAQTAALAEGSYRYELRRTDAGAETMLSKGAAEVFESLGW